VFEGASRRLGAGGVKVPHMGWNTVAWAPGPSHPYVLDVPDTWFYFVHSYAPPAGPDVVGAATYGDAVIAAAVATGNVFATQFHPEKSGTWGLALYTAFAKDVAAR
jgi:glutamine amidotransferase